MNALRIFISSPSDVQQERTVAGRVIERLQGKYWSFVRLDDVFWESKVARATAHFQDELLNPGQCDIVIGILWTRLGSPLPEKFRKLTGEAHATGTEWELAQAFTAYDASLAQTGDPLTARPDVVVYRRTEERASDPADADRQQQRAALDAFLEREFFNPDEHHTIRRAITFYVTPDEFEARLQSDLEQLILRRIPALKPGFEPPPISGPPFKDLAHFDFEDSDRFFGRNRAIRELQQRLMERAAEGMPFVLIYGGSGYGKSSLMRAGLAPAVTRPGGALAGMDRWRRVLLQPGKGSGPLCERLARVLLAPPAADDLAQQKLHEHWPLPGLPELHETTIEPDDTGEKWDAASLARLLADDTTLIYAAAGVARTLDRIGHSLLLQIDQLEEVFTCESVTAAERETFFRALAALTRTGRVWTVATMRSEYFPRIAEAPALAALVGKDGGYILAPPSEQELREIIRFPALAARLDYERATAPRQIAGALTTAEHLDDQILADAAGSPDALPLLEFTLHKLHAALLAPDGRRTGGLLRWDDYAALGGLKGAIAHTAEDTFAALPPHVQGACDVLFGNLVRVDAGSRDLLTRKRPVLADLQAAAPGVGEVLGAFLAARLLVTDEEGGHAVITLAHEALITHWPRLADWVARHRAILRSRQRLEENTRQWTESGHAKKLLLAEGRLAESEEVEKCGLFQLTAEELTLIAQSRQQARKRLRFFQAAAAVFAVVALAALAGGLFAVRQTREVEKKRLQAEAAATQARENLSQSDFLQALRSINDDRTHDALAQLTRSLALNPRNDAALCRLTTLLTYHSFPLPVSRLKHDGGVWDAQFSPDGKRIVTASDDKTARVWDAQSGQPLTEPLKHDGAVKSAWFSPDGKWIATASKDITAPEDNTAPLDLARVWDAQSGKPLMEPMKDDDAVYSVQFSPDGKRMVTASGDAARVWDVQTGKPLTEPMEGDADSAQFSPDGKRILTRSGDSAQVWDAQSGKPLTKPMEDGIDSAQFSPDGKRILTSSNSGARVWDAQSGQSLTSAKCANGGSGTAHVLSAQFSPDGKRFLMMSWDRLELMGRVEVLDAQSGEPLPPTERLKQAGGLGYETVQFRLEQSSEFESAQFSPDGKGIVTASMDTTARVWDAEIGEPLIEPMKHDGTVFSAQFSPDGKRMVTASRDGTARVWDVQSGQPLTSEDVEERIATRVWDAKSGQPLTSPWKDNAKVQSAQFSPDGKSIVTASEDNTARVWDAQTGKVLIGPLKHDGWVLSAHFSPDGKSIVTASRDFTARVWDAQTGLPLTAPLKHNDTVFSAQFSPDGKRIVTASGHWGRMILGGTARVWDAQSGQPLTEPFKHDSLVLSAEFTPDGNRIVSWSDNTARVWYISPSGQAPEWLPRLAEAVAGQHLNDRGVFEPLSKEPVQVLEEIRVQLSRAPADDDWTIWGRWFLADRSTRTTSPFSKITVPEYIENRIKENTSESLDKAERLAVGNAELLKRIAQARAIPAKETLKMQEEALALHRTENGPEHPDTLTAMTKLANSYADAGRWDEAFPLWIEASAHLPKDTQLALKIAALAVWFGKDADHVATSRRMLGLATGTDNASTAERAAKAFCLRPSSDPKPIKSAVTLARRAVELGKGHPNLEWYQMALGMAEYRHGNFPAADQALSAAAETVNGDPLVQGTARLFHAMSLFRQGKEAEARQLFDKAVEQMKPLPADEKQPLANGADADSVIVWLAYKEAKTLLK